MKLDGKLIKTFSEIRPEESLYDGETKLGKFMFWAYVVVLCSALIGSMVLYNLDFIK